MTLALGAASIPQQALGVELKLGRYVGWLALDGASERFALEADTFVVQPEDASQAPRLDAIFKVSLGGYGTSEYQSVTFEDIRYDAGDGILSLDEPRNDLVLSGEVREDGETPVITGQAYLRSAARSGTVELRYVTGTPGDGGAAGPFVTTLAGQYVGRCDQERSALQIVTGKSLGESREEPRGLESYGVAARLAVDDPSICAPDGSSGHRPFWCVERNFWNGHFNPFTGQLVLEEPTGSTECTVAAGRVQCSMRVLDHTVRCDFRKTDMKTTPFRLYERRYVLSPSAAQRSALPAFDPPRHAALVEALRGTFTGWLHNEVNDRYQPVQLNVMATPSTASGHDENDILITASAVRYFGRRLSSDFWPQQFERRRFSPGKGFTLESSVTDVFLQIDEWRAGYVRAVWYSRAFGRVGTVELLKGSELPALPSSAVVVPSVKGDFLGPNLDPTSSLRWTVKTIIPTQPVGRYESTLSFEGSMHLSGGIITPIKIAKGSYDAYTGAVAWLTDENDRARMVAGRLDDQGTLGVVWPGAPIWGVMLPEFTLVPFRRVSP